MHKLHKILKIGDYMPAFIKTLTLYLVANQTQAMAAAYLARLQHHLDDFL